MADSDRLELRGFDSYRVSLGDELRGERASLGKSLLDVQRDLRIKATHIDAIENSDPRKIPFDGFISGYVRAYARYLGLDEDQVLERFCRESGFDPSSVQLTDRTNRVKAACGGGLSAVMAGSRIAASSRASALNADLGSMLRGLGSLAVLVGLIGGIGYSGWLLLESIQRVEFRPVPDAPEVMAALPEFDSMTRVAHAALGPAPEIDVVALAAVYAAQEMPPAFVAEIRDGPISALDPLDSGIYARDHAHVRKAEPAFSAADPVVSESDDGESDVVAQAQTELEDIAQQDSVVLVAASEAWVRVRDSTGIVLHEALMKPGSRWVAPMDGGGMTLRAGNAGGIFLEVDGQRFGPLGGSGAVVSNVLLDADAIRRVFPRVAGAETADPVSVSALLDAGQ
jgi:cytoskeleton protein RodZ